MTLFRKTAELTCVISDYDHSCNRTIRQWYGGNPYVFLCRDGACRHQGKYVEKQDSMCKYTLKIYNFSENDVNCDYTCAYGVQSSRKMLKLDKKLFACKFTITVDNIVFRWEHSLQQLIGFFYVLKTDDLTYLNDWKIKI